MPPRPTWREPRRSGRAAVAGAIGPLGIRIEPFGQTSREEASAAFGVQVEGLLAGGVDGFILETFSDLDELQAAVHAVRAQCDLPIMAQVTIGTDVARRSTARRRRRSARWSRRWAPMRDRGELLGGPAGNPGGRGAAGARDQPARQSAQPNAGLPRDVGDRKIYMASPEYMAELRAADGGGGCAVRGRLLRHHPGAHQGDRVVRAERLTAPHDPADAGGGGTAAGVEPVPLAERSALGAKLARGAFVTTVEIVPPKGVDPGPMLDQCRQLRAAGVDAVNVPDGPRAQSRMGALLSGLLIEREVGIETVVHYACRDRNLLGMLSDLLGAAASGLRNLLLVTGDPPKMGPYPDATAVFDIDSIGLTNLVQRLNHGLDPGHNAIGLPTKFVIGVGVNPAATDFDRELKRLAWKVEAGAEFAVTQPVFDIQQLDRFLRAAEGFQLPIVGGIWPLVSLRNAEFLANEVPGVTVPDEILQRMRRASEQGREEALAEGVTIAREMLREVRDRLSGAQVSAPLGRVPVALEVLGPS
jgi:methionine synthase / methylenetetrahydrofolate reductase(NADPH)